MTHTPFSNVNLIIPFPEELNTPDWASLKNGAPAEFFLEAVLDAVLTGDQSRIEELTETIADAIEDGKSEEEIVIIQELVRRLSGTFFDVFMDLLDTILPENEPEAKLVQKVIYDHIHHDIYIIFNPEDECAVRIDSFGKLELDDDEDETAEPEEVVEDPDSIESDDTPPDEEDI
jgi:hypothetical protein